MSITSDALRKLAALNLDAEQMAGVLELLADVQEADEARRAKGRERVARHREAKRYGNVTVTQQPCYIPPLVPPSFLPPEPPYQTPPYNPPPISGTPRKRSEPSEFFDRFWSAYPKREGSNPKQPASKAFHRAVAAGTDPEAIIAGAHRLAAKEAGKDARFVPQAVTWLNQQRWGDDAPQATGPPVQAMPKFETLDEQHRWMRERQLPQLRAILNGHDSGEIRGSVATGDPLDGPERGRDEGLLPHRSSA